MFEFVFSPDSKLIAAPAWYSGRDLMNSLMEGPPQRKKAGPNDYNPALGPPDKPEQKTHVVIWDIDSGKRIQMLRPGVDHKPHGLAFSADGSTLAQQHNQTVYVHDVNTGNLASEFTVNTLPVVGFSKGRLIVGASAYDPSTGKKLFELTPTPWRSTISADGTRLVTSGIDDSTPLVWSLDR